MNSKKKQLFIKSEDRKLFDGRDWFDTKMTRLKKSG